jgi:pentatricopeptide repeat protein
LKRSDHVSYTDLKKWSQQWLEDTHNTRWTEEDVSLAQFLLQKWVDDRPENDRLASTKWAIRILRRWLQCEQQFRTDPRFIESILLIDNLHRLLHILGQLEETTTMKYSLHLSDSSTPCRDLSVDLLNLFSNAALQLQEPRLKPGNKATTMVLNTIAKRPDVRESAELAKDLVETHLKHGNDSVDLTTYSTYLHVLSCCSPYNNEAAKSAEQVLTEMQCPDAKCYGSVIRAWAGVNAPDAIQRAQFWFVRCLKENLLDNKTATITFNIVLSAWGRLDQAERAEHLLFDVIKLCEDGNFTFRGPDNLSFLMVLNAWNRSKLFSSPERVSKLLSTMKHFCDNHHFQLVHPSIEVYNVVLDTWAKQRNSGPRVESMLQQLEQEYERGGEAIPHPSLRSYVASIQAWANTASDYAVSHAQTTVKKLEQLGAEGATDFTPDTMVYTTLMQVYANSNNDDAVDKVLELLNKMHRLAQSGKRHAMPSVVTYNVVLHALVKYHELELAVEMLLKMVHSSSPFVPRPDTISYTSILHGLQHSKNRPVTKLIFEILDMMEEQVDTGDGDLVCPNAVYDAAVSVLLKHPGSGGAEEAEAILWRLQNRIGTGKSSVGPDHRLCNSVLKCWVRSKEGFAPERAEALFQWMQRTINSTNSSSLGPNAETKNLMIKVWAVSKRKGAWYRVKELYEDMKRDTKFDHGVCDFNQVLIALKNSDVEDKLLFAKEILKDILSTYKTNDRYPPNSQTFHILCDICESQSAHDKAESKNLLWYVIRMINEESIKISSPLKSKIRDLCLVLEINVNI